MHVLSYVYDSESTPSHVDAVLDRLAGREESVEVLDVATAGDRAAAIRDATLLVKDGVGIGSTPAELFDDDGNPDFSPGALVAEAETGRRSLHVGEAALEALDDDGR